MPTIPTTLAASPSLSTDECLSFVRSWLGWTGLSQITLTGLPSANTMSFTADSLESMATWITNRQRQTDSVYFEVNEARQGIQKKPTKGEMVSAVCRHADVDPVDSIYPWAEERSRLLGLADFLHNDPMMRPTVIIDSGNGFYPLWVTERQPLDAAAIVDIEQQNREIEAVVGASGTHNIDRLLRLPGTVNFPSDKKKKLGRGMSRARVLHASGIVYDQYQAREIGDHLAYRLKDSNLVRPYIASDKLDGGATNGDRSAVAFRVGSTLRAAGKTFEEMCEGIADDLETADWYAEKGEANNLRELRRIWERSPPTAEEDFGAAEAMPDILIIETETASKPRRRMLTIDELEAMGEPKWLIQGMVPECSLVMMDGPPKEGKTFIAVAMSLHIAAGKPWFGQEVVQGGVVYIAGEGSAGLKLRVKAMRLAYDIPSSVPFWVVPSIVDFGDKKDVKALADLIHETAGETTIAMVVIDTLARAMPGVEENSASEIGKVIASCDWLKEHLGCTVMPIHHQGKDTTRGSRGSSAIAGALDALFRISRSKCESFDVVTMTNVYQKEAEEVKPAYFDLTVSEAGKGGRTSLVPTLRLTPPPKSAETLASNPAMALNALQDAISESGKPLPVGKVFPPDVIGVLEDIWRDLFLKRKAKDSTEIDSSKAAFRRAVKSLVTDNYVVAGAGWCWLPSTQGSDFSAEVLPTDSLSDLNALML